jgi:predicted RNA-binding protein YlqC (UPF0109 family)
MSSAYTFEDFETFDDEPAAPEQRESSRRSRGGGRRGRSRGGNGGGTGALPRRVLEFTLEQLVEDTSAIEISQFSENGEFVFEVRVAQPDMGRVIGRKGRVAQALRSIVAAAGAREGSRATVDIVD